MKILWTFLILGVFAIGCKDKSLSSKHLSHISVVRETEESRNAEKNSITQPINNTPSSVYRQPQAESHTRYHIIVASFSESEKARAEKLVQQLKAKDYPAILINSSQRYRVSIESFATEAAANAARDEYRTITDRQDIWVHKVE